MDSDGDDTAAIVTGTDIPLELLDLVASFASQCSWRFADGWRRDLRYPSLVSLRWAKLYRQALWRGKIIDISSPQQAHWFKWLATTKGSDRLTPILELIVGVSSSQDPRRHPRSWLHLLYLESTRDKLRTLTFGSPSAASEYSFSAPFSLCRWGTLKSLPPRVVSYQHVTLNRIAFDTPDDVLKLLSTFTYTTTFRCSEICIPAGLDFGPSGKWTPSVPVRTRPPDHPPVKGVFGRCEGPARVVWFAPLCVALLRLDPAFPLLQAEEQMTIQELTGTLFSNSQVNAELCLTRDDSILAIASETAMTLYLSLAPARQPPGGTLTMTAEHAGLFSGSNHAPVNRNYLSRLCRLIDDLLPRLSELPSLQTLVVATTSYFSLRTIFERCRIRDFLSEHTDLHAKFVYQSETKNEPQGQVKPSADVREVWVVADPLTWNPTGEKWSREELLAHIRHGGRLCTAEA